MSLEPIYEIERDTEGMPLRMYCLGFQPSWKEQIMSWRTQAAPIIAKVIAETQGEDLHLLKDRLRKAYPFGPKTNHPYAIWRSEIKRQLGLKPPLHHGGQKVERVPEGQGRLFS